MDWNLVTAVFSILTLFVVVLELLVKDIYLDQLRVGKSIIHLKVGDTFLAYIWGDHRHFTITRIEGKLVVRMKEETDTLLKQHPKGDE